MRLPTPSAMRRTAVLAAFVVCAPLLSAFSSSKPDDSATPRTTDFVVTVVVRDFRNAQSGQQHIFNYRSGDSVESIARMLRNWFTKSDTASLSFGAADRQTLFAVYWAARQMPRDSTCFTDIDSEQCENDLAHWLSEVRSGNADFVSAYRQAQMRLELPPLSE